MTRPELWPAGQDCGICRVALTALRPLPSLDVGTADMGLIDPYTGTLVNLYLLDRLVRVTGPADAAHRLSTEEVWWLARSWRSRGAVLRDLPAMQPMHVEFRH